MIDKAELRELSKRKKAKCYEILDFNSRSRAAPILGSVLSHIVVTIATFRGVNLGFSNLSVIGKEIPVASSVGRSEIGCRCMMPEIRTLKP